MSSLKMFKAKKSVFNDGNEPPKKGEMNRMKMKRTNRTNKTNVGAADMNRGKIWSSSTKSTTSK